MMVNPKSLRAAVWAAIMSSPKPFIPFCRTIEPMSTMEYIRAMPQPALRSSAVEEAVNLKSPGFTMRKGRFFIR